MRIAVLVVLVGCASCRAAPTSPPPEDALPAAEASAAASDASAPVSASPPIPTPAATETKTETASASPSPASAGAPFALPPSTSTGDAGLCSIHITHVLDAQVFRGPGRDSPSRKAAIAGLSPEERSRWEGRDHSLKHTRCIYAVTMNGKRYRYEHIAKQAIGMHVQLDPALCHQEAERKKVQDDLLETTQRCGDPHAGAYWGFDLVEEP